MAPSPVATAPRTAVVVQPAESVTLPAGYTASVARFIGGLVLGGSPVHWERDVAFVAHRDGSIGLPPSDPAADTLMRRVNRLLARCGHCVDLAIPPAGPDSVVLVAHIASDPADPPLHFATPAGDLARYALEVDTAAMIRPGANMPTYPRTAQREERPGFAVAEFVVRPDGRPEPATIRILQATDKSFADAVAADVRLQRYWPAKLNGKAVPQVVQLPAFFWVRTEDTPVNVPPDAMMIRGFSITTVRKVF